MIYINLIMHIFAACKIRFVHTKKSRMPVMAHSSLPALKRTLNARMSLGSLVFCFVSHMSEHRKDPGMIFAVG